jgi:Caspase domain
MRPTPLRGCDAAETPRRYCRSTAFGAAVVNQLHFGVCVGIDRYPGFPGRDLGSARGDAIAFSQWLLGPEGGALPPDNVTVVTASAEEMWAQAWDARPQLKEVNRALDSYNRRLRDYLDADPASPNASRLYVYASGHGIGPMDGECGVLMADADLDNLGDHVELAKYRQWYEGFGKFREVVIFADCCREIPAAGVPANGPPFTWSGQPIGVHAFTGYASRLGEAAWEPKTTADRDAARGYFTRALLAGLRGGAVDPSLGVVTSTTLAQYVSQAVEESTRDVLAYPQKAEHKGDPAVPILFSSPAEPLRHRVTIQFPDGFSGDVVIRSAGGTEVARAQAAGADWAVELPDGYYEVAAATTTTSTDWLFKVVGVDVDVRL